MATTHPTTPVSRTEKRQQRRQKVDKGLAAILEVLNSAAATRVPLIQTGFSTAARIFEISQKVRANQDEFVEFAEEGCRLVYIISLKLGDTQEIEPNLKANLEELLETLQSIETFGEKCAARNTFKAVLLFGFDINEIKAQRRKLERCMRLFEFQSLVELREKTNQLVEQYGTGGGGVSNTTTNKNNVTENKISFGNDANFNGANGNVMGSGNVVNHNSNNNYGGGGGHRSNNIENNNNRVNNSISFGSGANFSNSTANAFGANNEINVNSNNRTGNAFGSDNAIDNNSQNRSNSQQGNNDNNGNNGNAQNDRQRPPGPGVNVNKTNNSNNVTTNDIKFGDGAAFTGANGNVFGANNQISHNSNNVYDSSTNIHNNGSNNMNVSNWGNNNQTHIGNNNSGNQGIIGGGSNNTVNSGANSGHQFFPNAANFTISGGEFSAVGGNSIRNNYGAGHVPN